jgi:prepilin-type N-terminal cleavage/methylation domain-containing protein
MPAAGARRDSGYSLIETLVSLMILTLALLLGVDAFLQHARAVRRMEAQRQAFRALESTMEAVRAGALPLESTWLDGFTTAVGTPAPKDLKVWMQVDPAIAPFLYEVHLQATYKMDGLSVQRNLHSMVYRPPASP